MANFTSWRGIERNFRLFSQFFSLPTPDFRTIRQWFLKLGLFELQQPKEPHDDWIFILDTTFGHSHKKYRQDFSLIDSIPSFGKKKFLSHFHPLLHYRPELNTYRGVLSVYSSAKQLLTQNGLHHKSVSDWLELSQTFPHSSEIQHSIQQVTQYLTTQSQHIPRSLVLPSRSDIIESLFGKYKQFRDSSSFSEINEMVLSFCLFTTELTTDKILTALEKITVNDLNTWIKQTFGQSFLSKRRQAFSIT